MHWDRGCAGLGAFLWICSASAMDFSCMHLLRTRIYSKLYSPPTYGLRQFKVRRQRRSYIRWELLPLQQLYPWSQETTSWHDYPSCESEKKRGPSTFGNWCHHLGVCFTFLLACVFLLQLVEEVTKAPVQSRVIIESSCTARSDGTDVLIPTIVVHIQRT